MLSKEISIFCFLGIGLFNSGWRSAIFALRTFILDTVCNSCEMIARYFPTRNLFSILLRIAVFILMIARDLSNLFPGLHVLPIEMPPKLQAEAQSTQGSLDQGLPHVFWQGVGQRMFLFQIEIFTHSKPSDDQEIEFLGQIISFVNQSSQDTTFEFERKRNRPVKYDRNVMMSTIRAMKRVQEIRAKRQERFFEARFVLNQICMTSSICDSFDRERSQSTD